MGSGMFRSIPRVVGLGAGVGILVALTVAVVFVARHREAAPVTAASAQAEFERLRARFTGQTPLVDMEVRATRSAPAGAGTQPLRTFHTVIFDRRGGDRLVEIAVPFWFGRSYARHEGSFAWLGELSFLDDTEFDPEPVRLSIEDIERHGPGLLVDYQHPGGGQFIAWVD
jgi:hypothetical protein